IAMSGRRVYLAGGPPPNILQGSSNSVQMATVQAGGALGSFSAVSSLVTGRVGATADVIGGYLYVVAGRAPLTGALASVERAPIPSDGTLGAFSAVGNLNTARAFHATVQAGGYLYVLGGLDNTGTISDIERAPIGAGGSLGAFAAAGMLSGPRSSPG